MSTGTDDDDVGMEDSAEVARKRVGTTLRDVWRVLRPLGCGGTAWVYVGAGSSGSLVAIKVLHSRLATHEEVTSRFMREAEVAKVINHPGVVQMYDEGMSDDDVPFMVMELLEGETLEERRLRKGGKLPVDEVLWATDQILGILMSAHKKGVVHRDIKPENIFLTTKNEIKVLDFGIARYRSGESSAATKIGSMLGSLHYMPPEQGRGDWDKVGVQTDLWAVGATMFALIAGRPVHDEKDLMSQLEAITRSPAPSLDKYAPEVSETVALLVAQALQFDSHRRWSDAATMQLALRITYHSGDNGTMPGSDEEAVDSLRAVDRPRIFSAPTLPPFSRRNDKP